ncbi:UNVERIFIED_CONTAM: hypothetical protein GTU68_046726 [Idotea baltica]|nr:hypothetical protein [Idotea baltica]
MKIDENLNICVVGLGYIGLPTAAVLGSRGYKVHGVEINPKAVETINSGKAHIVEPDLDILVRAAVTTGNLKAHTEPAESDIFMICVPTPLTAENKPELSYVRSATKSIVPFLKIGDLVILESTSPPGTTEMIESIVLEESEFKKGDIHFAHAPERVLPAYSPEREDPGNQNFTAGTIPKVVGGLEPNSLKIATAFYEQAITQVVPVNSCETAEACKILENTYRSVNIAMVNELKVLFQKIGIDVWEVIEAAKTKPFGFQAFYPGPGLGGHCIPIDPFYLSWVARKHEMPTKFIELAGEINTSMPLYVIHRLAEALNDAGKPIKGSKIGIFGIAYKKDIDDPRESPSFKLMELLAERGAELSYCDPHIPKLPKMRHFDVPELSHNEPTEKYVGSLDCVLIATDHSAFQWDDIVKNAKLVVDTRNATKDVTQGRKKIHMA